MTNYGKNLFKGTAAYYSKYRPVYPSSLIRMLVDRFRLDGKGQLLDLGCGTGQLTLRLSDWFEKMIGVDPEEEMLGEAERNRLAARVEHCEWKPGKAECYLKGVQTEKYRLVLMAKSFHWMDQSAVLASLYSQVDEEGGIAIVDAYDSNQEPEPWQLELDRIVKKWYGEERKAGKTVYAHPSMSYEERVSRSGFHAEVLRLPAYQHVWTADSIIGNLYSTSYGSIRWIEDRESFETELREALLRIHPDDAFMEEIRLTVILGQKKKTP
ncbi:class I SAM-dependent methyltransferase [Bacillus sp. FJAT-42376]|uniref:class I SAM-dependent DNA methyltransferase n=1 Tax=Bacillus sp. FJAT-42376 TaxID=2014076 RepID=UPI000F4D7293|nr:class I SAM-dependent methyltransferase [Bacillus sp. FJAT-42376]AZB41775.1 class I SAM-dependent methyltransferase [Bacillus sp. FJAT-42376]